MYALPAGVRDQLGLASIPCKIAFSSFLDETALAADLVLPLPLGLERLDDVYTPFGSGRVVYSLCPQIIKPLHGGRPPAEILLAALTALGADMRGADGQTVNSLENLLRIKAAQLGADYRSLLRGEAFTASPRDLPGESLADVAQDLSRYSRAIPPPDKLAAAFPAGELSLAPVSRLATGTAASGIPPYSARIISGRELQGNALFAQVNSATARGLGLKNGQRARLSARSGGAATPTVSLPVRVAISEGIMDNVIGLPLGYGHAGFDEFSRGKGVNGLDLYSLTAEGRDSAGEPSYCLLAAGLELKGA